MKEFNLSEKMFWAEEETYGAYYGEDVKEFIRRIKEWTFISDNEEFHDFARAMNTIIDNFAGEKLK